MSTMLSMEHFPANRKSFSATVPLHQIGWDSTSLGALKLCPYYYYLNIVFGMQSKHDNIHFTFGIELHAALEYYDRLKAQGEDHDPATRATIKQLFIRTWDVQRNRPWYSEDPYKNRFTLIRSVAWYLEQFRDDPLRTIILADGKPAVELSYSWPTHLSSHLTGETYWLCGHLDRMVYNMTDDAYIVDRKTTKGQIKDAFFEKFNPDNQMSGYYLAGKLAFSQEIRGIIIDAVQTGATFTRFQRGYTTRNQAQLDEWLRDTELWITQAARYAEAGYWPQNDKACDHYGGCVYRGICAMSPEVREKHLMAQFTRRVWDPFVTREV